MEKEGRRYFLFRTYPPFDWSGYRSAFYLVAIGYDAGGGGNCLCGTGTGRVLFLQLNTPGREATPPGPFNC